MGEVSKNKLKGVAGAKGGSGQLSPGSTAVQIPPINCLAYIARYLHFSRNEILNMDFYELNFWFHQAQEIIKMENSANGEQS